MVDVPPDSTYTPGELGKGGFTYTCVSSADPACSSGSTAGVAIPSAIPVGAQFGVGYATGDPVESASSDLVAPTILGFQALRSGHVALLAGREQVLDLLHLTLVPLEAVSIVPASSAGSIFITVKVGQATSLVVRAVNGSGDPMAGTLQCIWSSSDSTVVAVSTSQPVQSIEIEGVKAGKASITVTCGSVHDQTEVTVQ
jgi:hypothetical protein